jgi:hypothetical protein
MGGAEPSVQSESCGLINSCKGLQLIAKIIRLDSFWNRDKVSVVQSCFRLAPAIPRHL